MALPRAASTTPVVASTEGQLVTRPDTPYGSAELDLRTPEGRSGYRLDLGAVHNRGHLNVGVRIVGLFGTMRWTRNPERVSSGLMPRRPISRATTTPGLGDLLGHDARRRRLVDRAAASRGGRCRLQVRSLIFAGDLEHTARGHYARDDPWRLCGWRRARCAGQPPAAHAGLVIGGTARRAVLDRRPGADPGALAPGPRRGIVPNAEPFRSEGGEDRDRDEVRAGVRKRGGQRPPRTVSSVTSDRRSLQQ